MKKRREREREKKAEYRKKLKLKDGAKTKQQVQIKTKPSSIKKLREQLKYQKQLNRRLQERNEKLIQEKNPSDLKVGLGASPEAIQKQAQRVKSTLPQSPRKWARTVSPHNSQCLTKKTDCTKYHQDRKTTEWPERSETRRKGSFG